MSNFKKRDAIASFLKETKGSKLSLFRGKITEEKQLQLFGVILGNGTIKIDGFECTLSHYVIKDDNQEYTYHSQFCDFDTPREFDCNPHNEEKTMREMVAERNSDFKMTTFKGSK
jgi:hypothetical protein